MAAGARVKVLPTPLVAQLRGDDEAWIPTSTCLATAIDAPTATPCVLGDVHATTTVVAYGDSSANQWALDVAALGTADRFRVVVYVRAACPVGAVTVEVAGQHVDPGCAAFRTAVLADVAAMRPAPGLVVTSELRLSNYLTATGGSVTDASWSSGLTTTLDALEHDGLAVVELHGVPVEHFDPGSCLSAYPSDVQRCSTSPKASDPGRYDAATRAGTLAAHAGSVDLAPLFCTSTACPDVADDELTHAGDNHVDEAYASPLTAALGELLGCVTTQRLANRTAAAKVLAALDGASPSASFRRACASLKT